MRSLCVDRNHPDNQETNAMPRFNNMTVAAACTMLAAVLTSASAAAAAGDGALRDEVPTRRVKFADLDLTRSAGAEVLYTRIRSAAREVCPSAEIWIAGLRRSVRQCQAQAIAHAVADVNSPNLTTYYMEKTSSASERR